MAFNYKPINDNDVFPIAKDRINDIGKELARQSDKEFVDEINNIDFNTIHTTIEESGVYYLTQIKNSPISTNNGFVVLEKRNEKFAKVIYSPFSTSKVFIRTLSNGTWGSWEEVVLESALNDIQKYKLTDNNGQVEYNKSINSTNLQGTKSLYGTLQDPPIDENPEGWINYIQAQGDKSSIIEFTPVNSTKVYRKVRKLPEQTQNPNLLEDALFKKFSAYPRYTTYDFIENYTWETYAINSEISVSRDVTYEGNPTFMIKDTYNGNYPMVRSKPLKVGKDVQVGDKLTFSAYFMTPNKEALKDSNHAYIEVCKYTGVPGNINSSINKDTLKSDEIQNNQWNLMTVTVTVPNDCDYICALMRLNLAQAGTKNGFIGYYALPKLEQGTTRTPFITNVNDYNHNRYDEIWSQWIEYLDKVEMNKYVPDNMEIDYLDYVWVSGSTGGRSFYDLLDQVPRGTHTFYCSYNVIDNPSDKPIRGTIIVNYGSNNIYGDHKVTMYAVDDDGRMFTYHKEGNERTNIRQSDVKTTLWEGTLDFGESKEIELIEDFTNFDYLEVTYYTSSAGHRAVRRLNVDSGESSLNFYIRDFNVGNSSTGTGIDFFEGYMTNVGTKKFKTGMSKKVSHSGTGNASVQSWNTMSEIIIYNVVGVLGE